MTSFLSSIATLVDDKSEHGFNIHDHTTMNNRRLREENIALKNQVNEGRKKIQVLAKQLSAASADVAKSVQSVAHYESLESELAKCRGELYAERASLKDALDESKEMKEVINKLEEHVKEIEVTSKASKEASEEKIEALKNILQSVSAQVTEANSSKEKIASELAKTQQKVIVLEKGATEMLGKQKSLQQDLKTLSCEKAEMTKKISFMGASIQNKDMNQKKLETRIAEFSYDKQTLQRELAKAKDEIKKLVQSRDSLMVTVSKRDKVIETQRSVIQNMETAKAHGSVEQKRSKHEILMLSQAHDMALGDLDQLRASLESTQKTMMEQEQESQQKHAELTKELEELKVEKKKLENFLQETVASLEASREEVKSLKFKVQVREQQIEEEKEKLAALGCSEKAKVLNGGGKITLTESHF